MAKGIGIGIGIPSGALINSGAPALEGFIFDVDTAESGGSSSTQFELPLSGAGTTNILVDWGDGNTDTITSTSQAEKLHTYSSGGVYTITITGTLETFLVNNYADKGKIKEIKNWGNGNGLTLASNSGGFFYGASNVTCIATDQPATATANFQQIFRSASSIVSGVGNFDLSSVTSLLFGFYSASNFNEDLSNWDVSNVTNFNYCFERTRIDQSFAQWDMTSATSAVRMFRGRTLSVPNYDATLIGWAAQSLNNLVSIDFGNSQYSGSNATVVDARNTLIENYNWTIVDGGPA